MALFTTHRRINGRRGKREEHEGKEISEGEYCACSVERQGRLGKS
jgi:hypothetical protein